MAGVSGSLNLLSAVLVCLGGLVSGVLGRDWWLTQQVRKREELLLVFPTIKHLEQLAGHASVEQAMTDARSRRVLPVEPRVLTDGGVARVVLPGEPGYDD